MIIKTQKMAETGILWGRFSGWPKEETKNYKIQHPEPNYLGYYEGSQDLCALLFLKEQMVPQKSILIFGMAKILQAPVSVHMYDHTQVSKLV